MAVNSGALPEHEASVYEAEVTEFHLIVVISTRGTFKGLKSQQRLSASQTANAMTAVKCPRIFCLKLC